MFSKTQLENLIKAQYDLNQNYIPDFLNNVRKEKFLTAFQCEWAEFLESAPRFFDHKFWKPTLSDDTQNAKVEIVDILHFGLSLVIYSQIGVELKNNELEESKFSNFFKELEDRFTHRVIKKDLNWALYYFSEINQQIVDADKSYSFTYYLLVFLEILCDYVDWSFDDLYNAYWKKNELNLKRIKEGYMEGKYQKVIDGQEDNRSLDI